MAFIVPLVKKDYSIYARKVAPLRGSPGRCSFKGSHSTEKLEARTAKPQDTSECHLSSSPSDNRHVHFGQCEMISYCIYDDDTLFEENDENSSDSSELEPIRGVPKYEPVPAVLRSALRRPYNSLAMPPAKAQRQSSIRSVWKLAALCSPKN